MIAKLILSVVLVSGYALAIERGAEIRLWPNGAPGSEGETAAEVFESAANSKLPKRFTVVHYPSIYVFLAAKEKANGMAVVVAPGGGHSQLVIDKEGWEIAEWLNRNGIAAFVLKYRLGGAAGPHYTGEGGALGGGGGAGGGARGGLALHSGARCAGGRGAGRAHSAKPRCGMGCGSGAHRLHGLFGGRGTDRPDRDALRCGQRGRRRSGGARQLTSRFCRGHLSGIPARNDHGAERRASDVSDVHR